MTALMPRVFSQLDEFLDLERWMHLIRLEEVQEDDAYKIRAELPGMRPEDIKISVDRGVLSIDAERSEEKTQRYRSEFRYGSMHRSATLPAGADDKNIHASYDKGILEVTVPVGKETKAGRVIPVESGT